MIIGFPLALGLLFLYLKLTHQIDWSWLWVTSPFWILGIVAFLAILLILATRLLETPEETATRRYREHRKKLKDME